MSWQLHRCLPCRGLRCLNPTSASRKLHWDWQAGTGLRPVHAGECPPNTRIASRTHPVCWTCARLDLVWPLQEHMELVDAILPLAERFEAELHAIPASRGIRYDPGNWVRQNEHLFRLQALREDDGEYERVWKALVRVAEGPEYAQALTAVSEEPRLHARLNRLVGPANLGQGRLSPEDVTNSLLRRIAALRGGSARERVTKAIERELALRGMVTAPLVYLALVCGLDCDDLPISLGNGAKLDRMTDAELATCIRDGTLSSGLFAIPGSFRVDDSVAIRVVSEQPILVHDGKVADLPAPQPFYVMDADARQAIQDVLTGLQLLRRGNVSIPATFVSCPTFPSGFALHPGQQLRSSERQRLHASDANELQNLVSQVRAARDDHSIGVALRRFGYALERDRPEDRLLDLTIAGEAIFLDSNVEAASKFAQRATMLVESNAADRLMMFSFMKHVYGIRSKAAHGRDIRESDCRNRVGAPTTLVGLCGDFEEVMRRALRAVLDAKSAGQWPINWEALLFGAAALPGQSGT